MSDKYSLLIMRDSSERVRRLRFSVQLVKFVLAVLLLLVVLAVGGSVFSVYSYKQHKILLAENSELKTRLGETTMQLDRLKAYEALLKNSEEVIRLQMPLNEEAGAEKLSANQTVEEVDTHEVVASVFPDAVNATDAEADTAGASEIRKDGEPEGEAPKNESMSPAESPAKISNLEVRVRSPKSIRLAFDLNNDKQGVTLTGNVDIALISKDNKVIGITVPRHDMIFQINYYKKMSTAFPLPEGLSPSDIKLLQLTVNANGEQLQTETFPFPVPSQ
ncbi:MAG: hypothetical protein IJD04_06850 [Desulfovibrionaceae bacterium]|nr:hypothetical protein [Desulfovibrionaceae bacterium]